MKKYIFAFSFTFITALMANNNSILNEFLFYHKQMIDNSEWENIIDFEEKYYNISIKEARNKNDMHAAYVILNHLYYDYLRVGNLEKAKDLIIEFDKLLLEINNSKDFHFQKVNRILAFYYYSKRFKDVLDYCKKLKKIYKNLETSWISYGVKSAIILKDNNGLKFLSKEKKIYKIDKYLINFYFGEKLMNIEDIKNANEDLYNYLSKKINKNDLIKKMESDAYYKVFKNEYEIKKIFYESLP